MKRTKPKPTPEENFQHAIERPGTWFRFARRLLAHSLNEPTIEWGPLTEMIDSWARYRAEGLRRCVLLQGTPGTGKSTFARHAARRLSKRTVFMTSAGANNISASDWQLLLEMLAPQMVRHRRRGPAHGLDSRGQSADVRGTPLPGPLHHLHVE